MKKIGLLTLSLLAFLLLLVGCKTDNPEQNQPPVEPEVSHPRYSDIRILELEKEAGSIEVFVRALDTKAMIYAIVVPANSAAPTHEQIKKHETYSGVSIVTSLEAQGTLYKTVKDLEEGASYDVYVTLELNDVFAESFYKTTCKTKTLNETLDKGSGTPEDPYKVSTIEDLEEVANSSENSEALTAYYTLENDIDLSEKYGPTLLSFVPLSWQTGSLKAFNGYFDGKGHTVKNLYINETKESVGLFGQLGENGVVTNLILENPVVATTGQRLGAAVGYNKGTVADVFVIGGKVESLVPEGGQAKAGALVGDMYESGSILRCASKTTVVAAGNNIGGIAGSADASTGKTKALEIIDCYSLSDVTSSAKSKNVGGIVGYARCINILRCYATGNIEGGEAVGGIAGFFQHRDKSPIVPSIVSCFAMGVSITVTGLTQSNNSGIVIGNRSTSNNTNPVYEKLYYADCSLVGNQKTPQNLAEETVVTNFADKAWLKDTLGLDCNDVYWTMRETASRPTLVKSTWDNGSYETPLFITALTITAPNRNELSLHAEAVSGQLSYVVVAKDAKAPTASQILAHEDYDDVKIIAYGTSENASLDAVIPDLADETEYVIYVVAKAGDKLSLVSSVKGTTLAAPILLATEYTVTNGKNIGEIVLAISSNKAVTTYYFVSKTQVVLTKTELMEKESTTKTSVTITGLDENTLYYVYFYSKTSDEEVDVVEKSLTTTADLVDLSLDVKLTTELTAGTLKLEITSNKENTSIWYILGNPSDTYTVDQIKAGTFYEGSTTLDKLEDNTEYKVFVYAKTNTKETDVVTATATTINPIVPLAVEIDLEENHDDFEYTLVIATNKEVDVYYLVTASQDQPNAETLKALDSTKKLSISLENLEHDTTYYVYVLCSTGKEETEVMTKEFTTASLPEVTLEAELTNSGLVQYAQADATFEATEGATIYYLLTKEEIAANELSLTKLMESNTPSLNEIPGTTTDSKVEFRGLYSKTTYYLYACAVKDGFESSIVSKTIETGEYRNFNRPIENPYPTQKTINIYNAEDFYKYVEFSNVGLAIDAEGTIKQASSSANVTLYGNIYLNPNRKVDMIQPATSSKGEFSGTFDGQGFTIYNLTMESNASEIFGLYKAINGSDSGAGSFKNTNIVNANIKNTYEGSTSSPGNGIVCGELRGIIENVMVKDSSISVIQDDSRLGAIAGRFVNRDSAAYTAHISNCAVLNTTISGGTKNIGGVVGQAAYAAAYSTAESTRPEGNAMYISDIFVQATITTTGTQSSVGGVVGVSEISVLNAVSDVTIIANGKARKDSMIIGTCQNSSKETSVTSTIISCISYNVGTLVRNWKVSAVSDKLYEVGTTNSDDTKQGLIALEGITADWINDNTNFDLEGTEDILSLWVLEGNQLRLRIGGNI